MYRIALIVGRIVLIAIPSVPPSRKPLTLYKAQWVIRIRFRPC